MGPLKIDVSPVHGRICTLVGESDESVAAFQALCEGTPLLHMALLFEDLSSTLSTLSKKFCTPKGIIPDNR
jgi:thiamine biosynthesis protein ThiC